MYVALNEEENSEGKMYFDDGETFDYKNGSFMRRSIQFKEDTLTWEGEESSYVPDNRVTKAIIAGASSKFETAHLLEAGKGRQKVQLIKGDGYLLLEFVALASKNWKIVLS